MWKDGTYTTEQDRETGQEDQVLVTIVCCTYNDTFLNVPQTFSLYPQLEYLEYCMFQALILRFPPKNTVST